MLVVVDGGVVVGDGGSCFFFCLFSWKKLRAVLFFSSDLERDSALDVTPLHKKIHEQSH